MKYPGQLKNSKFRKLWFSDTLIGTADQIEILVISWVIITKTDSGLILGIYSAIRFVSTIFAPFIGGIIDNFNKKTTLKISRLYMLIHSLIFLYLSNNELLTTFNIIFITFFYGIARTSDRISRESLTQLLISKINLRNASALIRSIMDFAKIIGPIIGAIIYSYYGITQAYILISILYLFSFLIIFSIDLPAVSYHKINIIKEIQTGIKYLYKNKVLVSIMFFAGLANLILFTLPGAYLPFIIKDIINGNASDLALFNSFTAIGALIGSLILSLGNLSNSPGKLVFLFLIMWHITMFLTSIFTNKLLLTLLLVIYGAAGSITMISLAVLVLSITQKDMIGRIIGIRQLAIFTLPIGLVISGYLIDTIGIIFSIQSVTTIGLLITLILGYKSKKFMNYKNIN